MIRILLFATIALYSIGAKPNESTGKTVDQLTEYVNWFFQKSGPKIRRQAVNEFVPMVVTYSREYDVDPFLVATVITFESGWRHHVTGKIGEIGLMQVHGAATKEARRKGAKISTPQGQLIAGVSWLKRQIERCGGIVEGLSAYQTGKCKVIGAAKRRHRHYLKAVKQFRGER